MTAAAAPAELGPWMVDERNGCAFRAIKGLEGHAAFRMAFIEKTPRVRIRAWGPDPGPAHDHLNWAYGDKGGAQAYLDPEVRDWCDQMIELVGVHFPALNGLTQDERDEVIHVAKSWTPW